ncbi:putative serine/threonine-protein kinase iks1 [Serendipita sp. 411]|nr:putative serine/threonine-protein kinase iks1 [Serendipita sp. 411]
MDDEDTIAAIAARRKPYRVHIEPNVTTTTTTATATMDSTMDPTTFEQYNSPGLMSPPPSATSLMGQNENYGEEIGGIGGIGGGISGVIGGDNESSIRPSTPLPSQSPWLPILQSSNQLVLYNPYSHALTIMPSFLPPVLASTVRSRGLIRRPQRTYENEEEDDDDDDEGEGEGGSRNVHGQTNLAGTNGGGGGGALTTVQNHNGYIMDSSTNNQARCPFCSRPFSTRIGPLDLGPEEEVHSGIHNNSERVDTIDIGGGGGVGGIGGGGDGAGDRIVQRGEVSRRAPNYFQLLETSFEAQRRPPPLLSAPSSSISVVPSPSSEFVDTPVTPDDSSSRYSSTYSLRGQPGPSLSSSSSSSVPLRSGRKKHGFGGLVNEDSRPTTPQPRFSENSMAQGYFTAFFKEEKRLGMGANGTVYLCQHILNGNYLGHFAVKKIAVGHSQDYLLRILKEVRLLETLRHPNIITYHHSWLETTRFSSFGPSIPTLHVLMEWAECGSLDDLIDARLGKRAEVIPGSVVEDEETTSRSSRIRAFKAAKHTQESGASKDRNRGRSGSIGVHMLNAEEIKSFLSDIVSGLAFLHDRSILHLDLKMGNVLLTRDEERTIPRAMLSDFGTSQDALQTSRVRSGNTGT